MSRFLTAPKIQSPCKQDLQSADIRLPLTFKVTNKNRTQCPHLTCLSYINIIISHFSFIALSQGVKVTP